MFQETHVDQIYILTPESLSKEVQKIFPPKTLPKPVFIMGNYTKHHPFEFLQVIHDHLPIH